MLKFRKLFVATLAVMATVFSASICALGAQIESLSIIDNTIYAQIDAEDVRFFVAERSEGLLIDAFFTEPDDDGFVELPVNEWSELSVYVWDKDSLAPICSSYLIKNGRAYEDGSEVPIPEYVFSDYSFNQEDNVMIVSEINTTEIKGFKAGREVTYSLAGKVTLLGLAETMADIVPGCVILEGYNKVGEVSAIELLASLEFPINPAGFEEDFGVYDAADGSSKYKNVVTEMFSKSGSKLVCQNLPDTTKTTYNFESTSAMCYRIGIAISGDTPIITATGNKISTYPSIFENTAKYHNYLYLRYNSETQTVKECVYYCVPKDFNPEKGDDEYSPIFSLKPIVILK